MSSRLSSLGNARVLYPLLGVLLLGVLIALSRCPFTYAQAADFSLPVVSPDGQPGPDRMRLADQRGHVVLLDFWATWCGPCARSTPALQRLSQRFRARGLVVMGVNMDSDGPSEVPAFMRRHHADYPIVYDDQNVGARYEVRGLPTMVLIDRQGRIRRVHTGFIGESDLESEIAELL